MYVIVDKLNHCTAFKPKRSPWDNKYTHADIQVRSPRRGRSGRRALPAPPPGGSEQCTRERRPKKQHFQDGIQEEPEVPSVCSRNQNGPVRDVRVRRRHAPEGRTDGLTRSPFTSFQRREWPRPQLIQILRFLKCFSVSFSNLKTPF